MVVRFRKNARERFVLAAKEAYPNERLAMLLGEHLEDGSYDVEDVYFPPAQLAEGDENTTGYADEWYTDAKKYAREAGLEVLGDIHSHCYDLKYYKKPCLPDLSPSERDWDRCHTFRDKKFIFAICTVTKTSRGLRARVRFWPKLPKISLEIV